MIVHSGAFAQGQYYYRIRAKDTVSDVLYKLNIKPIYGKDGKLVQVLFHNPRLNKHTGNVINVGEKIYFPEELSEHLRSVAVISPEGEVSPMLRTLSSSSETPATPALPLPPVAPEPAVEENPSSDLQVLTNYGFMRLNGADNSNSTTASLLTEGYSGIDINWRQNWSNQWESELYFGNNSLTFYDADTKDLVGQKLTLVRAGLGVGFHVNRSSIKVLFGLSDVPFYRALTATELEIFKRTGMSKSLSLEQKLVSHNTLGLTANYTYSQIDGFEGSIISGAVLQKHALSLTLSQDYFKWQILGRGYYESGSAKSGSLEFAPTEVGIQFGLGYRLQEK